MHFKCSWNAICWRQPGGNHSELECTETRIGLMGWTVWWTRYFYLSVRVHTRTWWSSWALGVLGFNIENTPVGWLKQINFRSAFNLSYSANKYSSELRGTNPYDYRRERVVSDKQISAGLFIDIKSEENFGINWKKKTLLFYKRLHAFWLVDNNPFASVYAIH